MGPAVFAGSGVEPTPGSYGGVNNCRALLGSSDGTGGGFIPKFAEEFCEGGGIVNGWRWANDDNSARLTSGAKSLTMNIVTPSSVRTVFDPWLQIPSRI